MSPPEGSVPSPEFIWTYNWDLLNLVTTQVSSWLARTGKIWIYEALDPCKAHFLMRMIPLKKKSSNRLALLRPSPLQFMKFTLIFTRQPSGLGKKLGIKLTKVMGNKVGIRLLNFCWPFCCRGRHFIDVNIFLTSVVTWC